MKERKTLIEAWEKTPMSSGIIYALYTFLTGSQITVEWLPNEDVARAVDNYYYYFWSGNKFISPAIEKFMAIEDFDWKRQVMLDFWQVHKWQLDRQWANFSANYQAVNNYHVTEIVDYDHTGGNEYTDSGSDTKVRFGKVINYGKSETTNKANTYDGQLTDTTKSETDVKVGTPLTTDYGTGANNGLNDQTNYGKTRTGSESGHDDLTTTKSGNLGITPIAQLLQMDIELWKMNFFRSILFPMLDSAIALPIY